MVENTLWVEKYRPKTLDGYIANEDLKLRVADWLEQGDVPNLLFSGDAGTGKTTLGKIISLALDCDLLYINASDENNVDTVRDKIKGFASTYGSSKWKIVMLDECDYLTPNAQAALRQVMEAFSKHCRFILTCNYVERVIKPLQSRCSHFEITPPSKKDVAIRCVEILNLENVKFDKETLVTIINNTYPDIRKTIGELQRCSRKGELVVSSSTAIVSDYMNKILNELKNIKDVKTTFLNIRQIIADSRVRTFDDFYTFLFNNIDNYAAEGTQAMCILHIAESQYRYSFVVDKEIEICALIINLLKELK